MGIFYAERKINMSFKFSDLRAKEVIKINDGERMGFVSDIEIDLETGKIIAINVPGSYKMLGILGKEPDKAIKWENIKKIGDDLIMVV